MYTCIYVCIVIKTDTSRKQLYMTGGYITINKTKQEQANKQNKNIHSGFRLNLIRSTGEPEQK